MPIHVVYFIWLSKKHVKKRQLDNPISGSVAKSIGLPEEYKTAIADAFSRFPQVIDIVSLSFVHLLVNRK